MIEKVWTKKNGKIGSRDHVMRAWFAFHVMLTLTGGRAQCPNCATPYGTCQFDVDRTVTADRERIGSDVFDYYVAGQITMLCAPCNAHRSRLQADGLDWPHADEYREAVREASEGIVLPRESECRDWWASRTDYTANHVSGRWS